MNKRKPAAFFSGEAGEPEENPFRLLDLKRFPQKSGAARARAGKADARPEEPEEDFAGHMRASGVKAVSGARPSGMEPRPFQIMEETPEFAAVKKKIRQERKKNVARASEAPEPAPRTPEPEEEAELFRAAVSGVQPVSGKGRAVAVAPESKPGPEETSARQALQDVIEGKVEFALELTEEFIQGHVVGLDPVVVAKMRAGSYYPEAHLDLHGLNAGQAYDALVGFVRNAYQRGYRCVLVIPGRGKNSPDGLGILREKLQSWLTQEPFKRVVLAFSTAQARHGGPGAVYVLLRKYKKSRGKIHWDRLPRDPDLY